MRKTFRTDWTIHFFNWLFFSLRKSWGMGVRGRKASYWNVPLQELGHYMWDFWKDILLALISKISKSLIFSLRKTVVSHLKPWKWSDFGRTLQMHLSAHDTRASQPLGKRMLSRNLSCMHCTCILAWCFLYVNRKTTILDLLLIFNIHYIFSIINHYHFKVYLYIYIYIFCIIFL